MRKILNHEEMLKVMASLNLDDEDDDDSGDEDEMPECCVACGGPWPSCQTSCKIFDD